jgi:hypothetical protein
VLVVVWSRCWWTKPRGNFGYLMVARDKDFSQAVCRQGGLLLLTGKASVFWFSGIFIHFRAQTTWTPTILQNFEYTTHIVILFYSNVVGADDRFHLIKISRIHSWFCARADTPARTPNVARAHSTSCSPAHHEEIQEPFLPICSRRRHSTRYAVRLSAIHYHNP